VTELIDFDDWLAEELEDPEFKAEYERLAEDWERASDEALLNFERELDSGSGPGNDGE